MTEVAELSIAITASTKDIDAALRRVEQQVAKLGAGQKVKIDADAAPLAASLAKAERASIAFAQSQARLQKDLGNLTGAERTLQAALDGSTRSTTQTIGVQRQLLAVRKQMAAATVDEAAGISQQSSLMQKLGGAAVVAGGAFAVIGAANAALEIARAGASADLARASFDRMAASAGTSGDALIAQMSKAAKGTVAQTDIVRSSNTALLLLGNDVASKLPQLLSIATASAQTLGTDVGQVFDSLVTGISRGSTELIDNAGITVKAAEAYAVYGEQIGVSADNLSSAQKQQAILNAVLTSGQDIVARTAGGANDSALAIQQFDAALADLTSTGAQFVAQVGAPIAQGLANVARSATEGAAATRASGGTDAAALDPLIQASYESLTGAVRAYADAQIAAGASTGAALVAAQGYAQTLDAIGAAQATVGEQWDGSAESAATLAERMTALAQTGAGSELTIRALAQAYADGDLSIVQLQASLTAMETAQTAANQAATEGVAITQTAAQAAATAAEASNADASAKIAQGAAAELAAAQQDALKVAILEAAGSSATAEGAAQSIANKYHGVEIPAVIATINAYRALQAARAAAIAGPARSTGRQGGLIDDNAGGVASAVVTANERAIASASKLAEAQRRALLVGTGAGHAGSGGGGGGKTGAKAPKVSEAEKAAQAVSKVEEQYREAALTAEETYQERRLDIIANANAAILEAQQQLAVDSAGSRADFYDSLTSSDLPQAVQENLSAAYEEAFAKAQELSAAGQADLAADYLDLKERQLAAEQSFQEKLQAAKEKGDKGEVARLEAIKKLRDAALTAEESALLAGGSDAATTRDAALADAEKAKQEALGAAGEKAGDALATAQARLASSAGTSNLALQQQLDLLGKIQQAGGTVAPGVATGAAAPATAAPTPAPAAGGGGPLATIDAAAVAALSAIEAAVRDVRRAVGDLRNSGALGGG